MKKSLLIGIVLVVSIGMLSYKALEDKKYKVEMTELDWTGGYVWGKGAIEALKKSNLPSNQVLPLCDSLNKFLESFANQLRPQLAAQAKQDSTKKK